MSLGHAVNLSDSMIADINELPDMIVALPYSAAKKIKAFFLLILLPILVAGVLIHGTEYFAGILSTLAKQVLMGIACLAFLFMLIGFFRVQKYFVAQYTFGDSGIGVSGKLTKWHEVDHVEVLSEPRVKDKASIVLYLENEKQFAFKIKKHDVRMKVSEVIRRHVSNIAFKD